MNYFKSFLLSVMLLLIALAALYIYADQGQHTVLGTEHIGYVTKDVYSHYESPNIKIAVVTGMHPRENLSTNLAPEVVKLFAIMNKVEIADYHVTVTEQPQDFNQGRNNGESLVQKYVVPDIIKNSSYQLVIICHDHEKGYGEGYYVATPTRDGKSVSLGETVHQLLTQFNFYPGAQTSTNVKHSSSVVIVDKPLTNAGVPVFVYEIPEGSNPLEAVQMTYDLFATSYKVLMASNTRN